jgi:aerobic-type carbon monoxide dehydrogenase small subunit (CoxS/CutS family)
MTVQENPVKTKKRVELTINGKRVAVDVEPRRTLAELLREELGLTGTKVGCNRAECGACTVLLNGNPVYSCTVLALDASGKEVLTIEGLTQDENLHPLQEAFVDQDALQCGYSTPGMILSAKALLDRNPNPTEEDVKKAVEGNLCRCGSYPNIVGATIAASKKLAQSERVKS